MTQRSDQRARCRGFQARPVIVSCLVLAALSRCGAASAAGAPRQLPDPATFEISLLGRSAGKPLPERPGQLQLVLLEGKDEPCELPFILVLEVGLSGEEGTLVWTSLASSGRKRFTVTGESFMVTLENAEAPLAPYWVADVGDPLFPGITQPFFIRKGSLSFRVRGDEISGEIRATGSPSFDNPAQEQTYEATFTGRRVLDRPAPTRRKS